MSSTNTNRGLSDVVEGQSIDLSVYASVRRGFEEFMKINFHETGLLSRSQYESQRRFVEEAALDPKKLYEAHEAYVGSFAERTNEENLRVYRSFIEQLDDVQSEGIISSKSYDEWVAWIRDPVRNAPEKKQSINTVLPRYLNERRALAKERSDLRKDKRLAKVTDPTLRSEIAFLEGDNKWFNDLEFTQRKNLIDRIRAGLAAIEGGPEYEQLKKDAERILMEATKEPQPALHRDKVGTWLKRIFEEGPKKGASLKDMEHFVKESGQGTLAELIKVWRSVAVKFWTMRKDPIFDGVKTEFVNTKGFLWMHYDERVAYLGLMRRKCDRAAALRSRAWSLITGASHALDSEGTKRWLNEYVFNGSHTLGELESIINGNLAVRLEAKVDVCSRYEEVKKIALQHHGIRGMKVPEKSGFLKLHYDIQRTSVEEMEHRITELQKNRPDFLLIRHEMDRKGWSAAVALIKDGKEKTLSESDRKQLQSMETYVKQHQKHRGEKMKEIEDVGNEAAEIDTLVAGLPIGLKEMVFSLSDYGSTCVKMFGWGLYNREWANQRGYLDSDREMEAIRTGKMQALHKVRRTKRKGVVSETIQGETGNEEYIELSRSSATNVCLDISDAGAKTAFTETVHQKQNDHRAWYWTNIILHRGGTLMSLDQQVTENKKIYRIGRLLESLEKRGEHYAFQGTSVMLASRVRAMNEGRSQSAHVEANAQAS
ncbi:MAG TPA: hypothetical protein VJB82_01125 [Candidatus Peribacterales bacterium]|nr:hypothetical protein [Candidatus Peribacterales bacterium]